MYVLLSMQPLWSTYLAFRKRAVASFLDRTNLTPSAVVLPERWSFTQLIIHSSLSWNDARSGTYSCFTMYITEDPVSWLSS